MRIDRLEHVQLAIPPGGEALARAFYGGVIEIPEIPKPPNLAKRGGCALVRVTTRPAAPPGTPDRKSPLMVLAPRASEVTNCTTEIANQR